MNMIKNAALAVVAATASLMSAGIAEAASIVNFSYDYADPVTTNSSIPGPHSASIEGFLVGDITGDSVFVPNLALSSAEFIVDGLGLDIPLTLNTADPFTLDTGSPVELDLLFTVSGGSGSGNFFITNPAFFPGDLIAGGTYSDDDLIVGLSDYTLGEWNTQTLEVGGVEPIPTPALLPGLLAMGAAVRRRLNSEEEAA